MKLKNLPIPATQAPRCRRVYGTFWAPFGGVLDLLASLFPVMKAGFGVAAAATVMFLAVMFFMGDLTTASAVGALAVGLAGGCVLTLVFCVISVFTRTFSR